MEIRHQKPCNNNKADSSENIHIDPLTKQLKIEVYDSSALTIVDPSATFEILAKGFYWSEGPLWVDELQAVLFSDVPANKIYKWSERDSLSICLEFAGHSGKENKDSDKGPNDLVMDRAGNIYFTDPPYGQPENKTGEIGINGVFIVSPNKDVSLLVDSLTMLNGVALSLDQKTLYINQSDPSVGSTTFRTV